MALTPHPELWRNFIQAKTSSSSRFYDQLVRKVVSISVPATHTNRGVVEQIAKACEISLESLSEDLSEPVFSRGQTIFGFAGDELDRVADNYSNMRWWVSDAGLSMAIVSTTVWKHSRKRQLDAGIQNLKARVRKLRHEGLTHRQICDRLGNSARPPRATWRDLEWPLAYRRHTAAVAKWLSDALR
jgi:hypothetical protein